MTEQDLIQKAFAYLNSYKRHRALSHIKRLEGDKTGAQFHQLKEYQFIDSLELALRAIQKGARDMEEYERGKGGEEE